MAYDRDDFGLFTYDNLPDIIAEGIQKFVDNAEDKDVQTAAESLLFSSMQSVRRFDSTDAGLGAIYDILKDIADGKTNTDINAAFKEFVEQARSNDSAKNSAASESDNHASQNNANIAAKKRDDESSVMAQTSSARQFFSDLGILSLSKSIAKWSSLFDSLGTKRDAIAGLVSNLSEAANIMGKYMPSSISEAFDNLGGTIANLKTGLSEISLKKAEGKTGHLTDTKSETSNWFSGASAGNAAERQQNANRDDEFQVSEENRTNEALSLAASSMSVIADNVDLYTGSMTTDQQSEFTKKLSDYIDRKQIASDNLEALSAATNIADEIMGNVTGSPNAAQSLLGLDAESFGNTVKWLWNNPDTASNSSNDSFSSVVDAISNGLQLANTVSGGKVSSAAGNLAGKVLGKSATSAATDAAAAGAATDAVGSGLLSTALGGLSKLAGPIAIGAGLVTWGASQARQATIQGNLQGGGLSSGIGMKIRDFGQGLANDLGFTDVSSSDLQRYRQSTSKSGYDIDSEQGKSAISIQKWAQNNGLDSSIALSYANSMLHAGESADDVKEQFGELKDTAKELGIDFNNLAEAAADNATRLRQAGVEDSGAQATEDTEELEQLLRNSGFDEVTAQNIASVTNSDMFKMSVAQMAAKNGDQNAIYGIQSDGAYALRYLNEYGGKDAIQQAYDNALSYVGRMTEGMSTSNGGDLSKQAMQNQLAQQFMGITPNSGSELSSAVQQAYGNVVVNVTNTIGTDTQDRVQANAIRNNSYYGNGQSNIQVNNSGTR